MSKKKSTTKTGSTKNPRTGEALRKQAIADADRNIAAIEAAEKAPDTKSTERDDTTLAEFFPRQAKKSRKSASAARVEGAAKVKAATKPSKAAKPHRNERKISGLDAAAKVLTESTEPLNATTIAEKAIAAGWVTNGKTPHATLYAAMIREIAVKGRESRFKKTERGLFTATGRGA
jgi:hypothetical protein